jgi:hypothetical protein
MVARFLADAAAERPESIEVMMYRSVAEFEGDLARADADMAFVDLAEADAGALASRLFRRSPLSVLVRVSTAGDRADIHVPGAPARQLTALDAPELLARALRLTRTREGRPDGRP